MLLIVAAEQMDQSLQSDRRPFEHRRPRELRRVESRDHLNYPRPRRAKRGECIGCIGIDIIAIPSEPVSVDGRERRIVFFKWPPKPQMVPLDLDIPHMTDLLDRRE